MASSSSSSPKATEHRDWIALPREVTAAIISRLVAVEILRSAQFVCKSWHEVCKDPLVWFNINFYDIDDPLSPAVYTLDRMCRRAVDRSSGQLVGIGIAYFGNDDLTRYIVDRCTRIKTLRLGCCNFMSDKSLTEATARLPLLEELDLTLCSFTAKSLEPVGRSCPLLKSLKLNFRAWRADSMSPDDDRNAEAIAIAQNMAELRHLQLIGNPMTNTGLKAILAGCPRLESLDIRLCKFIDLNGKSEERSAIEKIKRVWFPAESTKGCGFYVGVDEVDYSKFRWDDCLDDGSVHEPDEDYDYLSYSSGIDSSDDGNNFGFLPDDYF